MGLAFESWWALALLPVCLCIVWWIDWRYSVNRRSLKRRVTLWVRMALVAVLVLAVAGPSLLRTSASVAHWVLLDASDSASSVRVQAEALVSEALSELPKGRQAGVIAFGADAMVETPLSGTPSFSGLHTQVNGQQTDLDRALRLAAALLPSGGMTVVTDGKTGVSRAVTDSLAAGGMVVDALVLTQEAAADAQITELGAPSEAYEGQRVALRAVIDSNTAMDATLALYQNGILSETRQITLQKGENRFAFSDTASQTGVVTYEARLLCAQDTQSRNNSAAAYVRVLGAPSIALVGQSTGVRALFDAAGMAVETLTPAEMPKAAEGYLGYDAIVLNNVDYESATEKQWKALDAAVRSLGRGLCVLGGDSSFALGGYRGTVLEELLPVRIDVRQKLRMPALSLVICIDKSGSMTDGQFGSTRIEVAKEAAMSAVEVLTEQDNVGVIGFDEAAKWVVPFQSVTDPAAIVAQIGTMRADGGTAFYSAMEEAFLALRSVTTPQKHVIFLSDGQPGDTGFQELARAMKDAGITLTTVAVGGGADQSLMRQMALLGGGRSYAAGEFDDVPKLFVKETVLAGGSYVQNRSFYPVVTETGSLTRYEGFPSLSGYLTTVEKESAHVALTSDTQDPLLAWWNAGAGKVLAWMSDAEGAWTSQFLNWEEAPRFFGGLVSQTLPGDSLVGTLEARVDGDALQVTYRADEDDAEHTTDTKAVILAPDGTETTLPLVETSPGIYTARTDAPAQGAYAIRVAQSGEDGVIRSREGGAVKGFSQEYDMRIQPDGTLKQLCERTGGRLLTAGDCFWDTPLQPAMSRKSLRDALCVAVLLLFLADIALRKLPWEEAFEKARATKPAPAPDSKLARPKPKAKPQKAAQPEQTANALLEAKRARKQS